MGLPTDLNARKYDRVGVSADGGSRAHSDEGETARGDRLDDDSLQEISVLLLLTEKEQDSSLMNFEFNDPIPSGF